MPARLPTRIRLPVTTNRIFYSPTTTATTTATRFAAAVRHTGSSQPSLRPYVNTTKPSHQQAMTDSQPPPPKPVFSKDVPDVAALVAKVDPLLVQNGGRWTLVNGGEALEREFRFKGFAKCWDFMTAVSLQCKVKNHHPEWSNVYNTTFIRWTTHSPKGLSVKDVELAAACDALAKDFGEVVEEGKGAATVSCEVKGLADRVVGAAGDCCTPKSAKQ